MHTGNKPVHSRHRLLTSLAATVDANPHMFSKEGLRRRVAMAARRFAFDFAIQRYRSIGSKIIPEEPIMLVPGLVGLGHCTSARCAAFFGLTRSTTPAELGAVPKASHCKWWTTPPPIRTWVRRWTYALTAACAMAGSAVPGHGLGGPWSALVGATAQRGFLAGLQGGLAHLNARKLTQTGQRFEPLMESTKRLAKVELYDALQAGSPLYAPTEKSCSPVKYLQCCLQLQQVCHEDPLTRYRSVFKGQARFEEV